MRTTYGRTAYVGGCGSRMLDLIEGHTCHVATGNDLVIIEREELIVKLEWLGTHERTDVEGELYTFLLEVDAGLKDEYDCIQFYK